MIAGLAQEGPACALELLRSPSYDRPLSGRLSVIGHRTRHQEKPYVVLGCTDGPPSHADDVADGLSHGAEHPADGLLADHSEIVAPELARTDGETDEQKTARAQAWITNRVPDIRFLLDHLLNGAAWESEAKLDPAEVGIVGHSFGGWTALAATGVEPRIRAVVALAPAGASHPKPGILPVMLAFRWDRDVPTLYLVAENDISLPLAGMYELFERTPATKHMIVLRRADHLHFIDDVERAHEAVRAMQFSGELAWIPQEMRPIAELCSGEQAHVFVCGLTLCHFDATLRRRAQARRFLAGDIAAELAERGVEAFVHRL